MRSVLQEGTCQGWGAPCGCLGVTRADLLQHCGASRGRETTAILPCVGAGGPATGGKASRCARRNLHSVRVGRRRQAGSVGGPSNSSLERPSGSTVAWRTVVILRPSGGCGAWVVGLPDAAQL